jgi:phosphoribosylformylglycinamidine synthase
MRCAVVQFPGSNCDQDCVHVLGQVLGHDAYLVWHKEHSLGNADVVVIPGGFSYGDYLRCGAIARFSPVMDAVRKAAQSGTTVIGICNGFQVLCEAGLLPGALVRNRGLHFLCGDVFLRVETPQSRFTQRLHTGRVLRMPIAHGEGCFFADSATLRQLQDHGQILFSYCDANGSANKLANPNGSLFNIAGICNRERNILGMMPHPERACENLLGSEDGREILASLLAPHQEGIPELS